MLQRRIFLARVILACVAAIQQAMVSSALVHMLGAICGPAQSANCDSQSLQTGRFKSPVCRLYATQAWFTNRNPVCKLR